MFDYPVELAQDDNGTVLATFPDVPEAITFGSDDDEALLRAVDALETALSFYVDARQPLPVPSKARRGGSRRCARPRWNVPSWASIRR
jgi:antitoxin HicB